MKDITTEVTGRNGSFPDAQNTAKVPFERQVLGAKRPLTGGNYWPAVVSPDPFLSLRRRSAPRSMQKLMANIWSTGGQIAPDYGWPRSVSSYRQPFLFEVHV